MTMTRDDSLTQIARSTSHSLRGLTAGEVRLDVRHFLAESTKELRVLVEPETQSNIDTPPRMGRLGDVIYASSTACRGVTRLHSKSWDCWEVITAPAYDTPYRTRVVLVSDPYDRYRHGSSIDAWRKSRRAELSAYGLDYQQVELVIAHELGVSAQREKTFRASINV